MEDIRDPRSIHYPRVLVRPRLKWWKGLLLLLGFLLLEGAAAWLMVKAGWSGWLRFVGGLGLALVYLLALLKPIVCGLVRLYQRLAPRGVRRRCRFEPSCSQYMLLAIERYGIWKGLRKGLGRLGRCNINGGGYDWP